MYFESFGSVQLKDEPLVPGALEVLRDVSNGVAVLLFWVDHIDA